MYRQQVKAEPAAPYGVPEYIMQQFVTAASPVTVPVVSMPRQWMLSTHICLQAAIVICEPLLGYVVKLRNELSFRLGECIGTPAAVAALFSAFVLPHCCHGR